MDIRVVESVATSGCMVDPLYRIDGDIENISLAWDEPNQNLSIVDYNIDYMSLPFQIGTDMVKKTFLTYNGRTCAGQMLETVLIQSKNDADANHIPGYNNSNEWPYNPSTYKFPTEILSLTNTADYSMMPYDYSQGFTVVKQFLTAQANLAPGTPAYTAFYNAPHLTTFLPANVDCGRIYVDGWYTSYVIAVKTWAVLDPLNNGITAGDIFFYPLNNTFYINTTGQAGSLTLDPTTNIMIPDIINYRPDPTFSEWQALMMVYAAQVAMPNNVIYFAETQHLVTIELNKAILTELLKQASCCEQPDFDSSKIITYMKLLQKRMGAYMQFNKGIYHEASCILESCRKLCDICLYHQSYGAYNSICKTC